MDLPDFSQMSASERTFRDDLRDAIRRHRPSRDALGADSLAARRLWQHQMAAERWVAIGWPEEWGGRSASSREQAIYNREFALTGVPPFPNHIALNMLGPTLIKFGTDWQRERFLQPLLSGEELWCQLFSEPETGSDLASLRTRGEFRGDELTITGSKIWITNAQHADYGFALVRTGPAEPGPNHGLTYVLIDMHAPGVGVRPIEQATGQRNFNEVRLDEVATPRSNVVGAIGNGWTVARATLDFERSGQNNIVANHKTLTAIVKILQDEALSAPTVNDLSTKAAWSAIQLEGIRRIGEEVLGGEAAAGSRASVAKLLGTELRQSLAQLAVDSLGDWGVVTADSPVKRKHGNAAFEVISARQATIGGGTSEMQRNIIAERILGLPRDARTR
jgi:alkylation response protein AidB-like acyl-CoA dehydrogenase